MTSDSKGVLSRLHLLLCLFYNREHDSADKKKASIHTTSGQSKGVVPCGGYPFWLLT